MLAAGVLVGCTSSGGTTSSTAGNSGPIIIGASLSLHGPRSADGQAFERGYDLWANDVNAHGGLLGRQVELKILDDQS
jgi:branched-chain amino acid transport system substrate-binding protein